MKSEGKIWRPGSTSHRNESRAGLPLASAGRRRQFTRPQAAPPVALSVSSLGGLQKPGVQRHSNMSRRASGGPQPDSRNPTACRLPTSGTPCQPCASVWNQVHKKNRGCMAAARQAGAGGQPNEPGILSAGAPPPWPGGCCPPTGALTSPRRAWRAGLGTCGAAHPSPPPLPAAWPPRHPPSANRRRSSSRLRLAQCLGGLVDGQDC